jgi:hypothetical protein
MAATSAARKGRSLKAARRRDIEPHGRCAMLLKALAEQGSFDDPVRLVAGAVGGQVEPAGGAEPSALSQHLAVLRESNVVVTSGSTQHPLLASRGCGYAYHRDLCAVLRRLSARGARLPKWCNCDVAGTPRGGRQAAQAAHAPGRRRLIARLSNVHYLRAQLVRTPRNDDCLQNQRGWLGRRRRLNLMHGGT